MTTHGFVFRYQTLKAVADHTAPNVRRHNWGTTADGANFRLFVRPFVTTPEAARERQPFVTRSAVLAYSGRIDNRKDIADRIGKPFLQHATDGEIFAESFARWGKSFPAKVIGEYSVALIDREIGQLVAARDSLGIGRLFRYETKDAVWIASSLDLLLYALPVRPSFDSVALAEYFAGGGLITSGSTIYQGIRELPPAHVLTQLVDGPRVERYWQPDPAYRLPLSKNEEYDEEFRYLLFSATRAAMRSNTTIASDLSGGLDSSSVSAAAALIKNAEHDTSNLLLTFSILASKTGLGDESAFQNQFLEAHPLPQLTVDVDEHAQLDPFKEPPSCHPSKAILYRPLWSTVQSVFASHGVIAHLTGRGGDAVFCGDEFPPLYLGESLRRFELRKWLRECMQWSQRGDRSWLNLLTQCSLGRLRGPNAGLHNAEPPLWLSPKFRHEVRAAESTSWLSGPRLYESAARELQYRSIIMSSAIVRFISVGDERSPLLYRPLVEFVLALPWEHLLKPSHNRIIQRRGLRNILPEQIRKRNSKSSGTGVLIRGISENWLNIRPITVGRRLAELDLVDPKGFHSACDRFRHGLMSKNLRYIAAALSLEIWLGANERRAENHEIETYFSLPDGALTSTV